MRSITNLRLTMIFAMLLACGDSSATGEGGEDSGPAGPGSGPGPTSSGVGASGAGGDSSDGGAGASISTGGVGEGGATGGAPPDDCFMDPMTHIEIINACTDADYIDKVEQVGIWDEGDPLPPLP